MKRRTFLSFSATLPLLPGLAYRAEAAVEGDEPLFEPVKTVSTGAEIALKAHLTPEAPTVFVFYRPGSGMEKDFVKSLQKSAKEKVGFRLIELTSGEEPAAHQYQVIKTPTALVYDRRGRLLLRSDEAAAIQAAVAKAAQIMRIDWPEMETPEFAAAEKAIGHPLRAGILRTMSPKPEYLYHMDAVANVAHFKDGFLPRRTKEMIATYVSALNKCKY